MKYSQRICVDCKYLSRDWFTFRLPTCEHPLAMGVDPVYGTKPSAREVRERVSECGPDGKWWEARNPGMGMP